MKFFGRRAKHRLSEAEIEDLETCFCMEGGEASALLERAASDRGAYDEIEAVLRLALEDEQYVTSSFKNAEAMKLAMGTEPTYPYHITRRSVEGARVLAARTPRKCLEMTLGRELRDEEWDGVDLRAMRELFERAWLDRSPFSSPTLTWLEVQSNRQHLLYLRRRYRGR